MQHVPAAKKKTATTSARIHDTFIVGAGISGLAAAIKLREAGLHDFRIIEQAARVGGTWRENTYPGCGCDVPSALYSYSFFLSSKWSRLFAKQPEILSYLEEVSDKLQITPLIESGAIRPVIDKVFPFDATNEALAYVESGRAKGKVVIKVR